jgi:hypothetical protein
MTQTEIAVKMVLERWNASIKNVDTLLELLNDEKLSNEIAPNKNRGIYILGHLIAVHDDMLILLNMGEKIYPELNEPFIKLADKATDKIPTLVELRGFWINQCNIMNEQFSTMKPTDWFEKHTAVTTEDFEKEPTRNKLNIIITRTSHLQYHLGQLQLLK